MIFRWAGFARPTKNHYLNTTIKNRTEIMGAFRVKICGITQPDQGQAIAQLGATALGFICVQRSPRYVAPIKIRAIVDAVNTIDPAQAIHRVGVFVDETPEAIAEVVAIAQLTAVQLHGSESTAVCHQLRALLPQIELIKAVRVKNSDSLQQAIALAEVVDVLLLDAYHPHLYGGTGQTLNWSALQQFRPGCPWLLAGGLNPDNITEALQQLHPDGIDLSSGVEVSPGNKDLTKVAQLFAALRQRVTIPSDAR